VTLQELGSLGELLAAIATIATLAYLALQIRQSNRSHQISAITRISESTESWIDRVIEDPDVLDVYIRGLTDHESLDRQQRIRFELLVMRLLRGTEGAWLQLEWGLVDQEYWSGFRATLVSIVGSQGGRKAFARNRHLLNPRYAEAVEEIIGDDGAARSAPAAG